MIGVSPGRWRTVNRAVILSVTALTTPLALFLAPLAIVRVVRTRRADSAVVAWAVAVVIQFAAILVVRPERSVGEAGNPRRILAHYNQRVLYDNFLPRQLANNTLSHLAALGAVLLVTAAFLAWRRGRPSRRCCCCSYRLSDSRSGRIAPSTTGHRRDIGCSPPCASRGRYWLVEEIVRMRRPHGIANSVLPAFVVAVLPLTWMTYWQPVRYRSSGPTWPNALTAASERCRANPSRDINVTISPVAPNARLDRQSSMPRDRRSLIRSCRSIDRRLPGALVTV